LSLEAAEAFLLAMENDKSAAALKCNLENIENGQSVDVSF
jgi:hypothetical protein